MSWHYAENEEKKGPVTDEEFEQLAKNGVISADTLVWQAGMNDWRPYQEVQAERGFSSADGTVVCAECQQSFPLDEVIRLGERHICAACKPLAVQKMQEGNVDDRDEEIRNEHIKHEASIRSVRILYYLPALGLTFGGIGMSYGGDRQVLAVGAAFLAIGVLCLFVAHGIGKLRRWTRIPVGILSGIGVLNIPFGTLINGYILWLFFSKKGTMVFSDEYQGIIERTPHIKYKTPVLVIIFGVLIIALLAGALIYGLTSGG